MPIAAVTCAVTPERVFEVLSDPETYSHWVVGARSVEGHDPAWPDEGTAFAHTQGKWPLVISDETVAAESDPPRRLVLIAKARPMLIARVDIKLTPEAGGTRVTMEERPIGGLIGPLMKIPPGTTLTRRRNQESLRRLCRLAEGDVSRR